MAPSDPRPAAKPPALAGGAPKRLPAADAAPKTPIYELAKPAAAAACEPGI